MTWGLGGLWNGDFGRHLHSGGMGLGDLQLVTLALRGLWNGDFLELGMGLHRNLGTWGLGGLWNGDFRRHLHSGGMELGDLVTLI